MKRRIMAVITGIITMAAVCGCGAQQTVTDRVVQSDMVEETEVQSETVTQTINETESETEQTLETITTAEQENAVIDRSETFALLNDMKAGWNLGNTLDAHASADLTSETSWGNPKTTPEMIQAIAQEGFHTLRIPVTWSKHVSAGPEYKIDAAWMDRVEEVVKYALDCDMYVILDTHHEPDYWLKPQSDGLDEVQNELCAIWQQIAERFADYDEHLLFEGMNEPRIKGSAQEWSGGDADGRAAVNTLNQAFVDTVRAVGGKNETRTLIICPYGNSVTYNTMVELDIPQDEHIAVAVHLYTPYYFTYEPEGGSINVWNGTLKKDIISNMQLVDKELIQKGVPVIITEFGAVHKVFQDADGNTVSNQEEVLKWLADYMETANKYGIPCVWWDNGIYNTSGEQFGLFDRKNLTWFDQDIADAFVKYAQQTE
ncbi:MAG: glycoside hydrolase family 5 protein [Lachnospiraceae bacterium]|nr:glycoside hydrolase family 5 protein [Lachnospiraceae bacterium]